MNRRSYSYDQLATGFGIFVIVAIASCLLLSGFAMGWHQCNRHHSATAYEAQQILWNTNSDARVEAEQPPWYDGTAGASDPHDSQWNSLVRGLNKTPTTCAACGGTGPINWHHVRPWHECTGDLKPLRYSRDNLIPLCTDPRRKCHWIFGHLGVSWSASNPDVRKHAAAHLKAVNAARERLKAGD